MSNTIAASAAFLAWVNKKNYKLSDEPIICVWDDNKEIISPLELAVEAFNEGTNHPDRDMQKRMLSKFISHLSNYGYTDFAEDIHEGAAETFLNSLEGETNG